MPRYQCLNTVSKQLDGNDTINRLAELLSWTQSFQCPTCAHTVQPHCSLWKSPRLWACHRLKLPAALSATLRCSTTSQMHCLKAQEAFKQTVLLSAHHTSGCPAPSGSAETQDRTGRAFSHKPPSRLTQLSALCAPSLRLIKKKENSKNNKVTQTELYRCPTDQVING